ncbi:IS6 family transposase [bacterium]|nr:IS6 family transposase [bacterium]
MISFERHRFPKDIIINAVRWYLKYKLSFSDVSELLLERGVNVSREAIREWVQKFGPQIGSVLDRKRRKTGKRWHVDETYVKVAGVWKYVYQAVDEDMQVIDVYVSNNRDKMSAKRFFKNCLKVTGDIPESIRSDSHRGYDQVKEIFPNTRHHKVKCLNNKAESSHVPLKQRYRPMRGFKNFDTMEIFLISFESMYRFFRRIRLNNRQMRVLYKERLAEFSDLFQVNCAYNETR